MKKEESKYTLKKIAFQQVRAAGTEGIDQAGGFTKVYQDKKLFI